MEIERRIMPSVSVLKRNQVQLLLRDDSRWSEVDKKRKF
jgi:hypothetical protein